MKFDLLAKEEILEEQYCSHMRGIEAVGGKIAITNKRFLFQSHKFNLHNHTLEINLKDIISVEKSRLYKYFPGKGIKLVLKDGSEEVFSPRNKKRLIEIVEHQLK